MAEITLPTQSSTTTANSTPTGVSTAPIVPTFSPAVVTSKAATNDINNIKTKHADIVSGITNQATTIANAKAQTDAQAKAKADAEANAKAVADKLAIDKQTADAKTAAVNGTTTTTAPTTMTDAEVRAIAGNDFTGFQKQPDGTYVADSYAKDKWEIGVDKNSVVKDDLAKAQADYQATAKTVQDSITNIQNGTIPLNEGELAQINGLKQQFQQLIDQQVLANTNAEGMGNIRGYQTGAAEYDPTFQAKTIGSIVTAGLNKVADLNIKMSSAVAKLTQAFHDDDIKAVKDAWDIYQTASKARTDSLQKTIDDTNKAIKEAKDASIQAEKNYYDRVSKPVDDLAKEAAKNGADSTTIANIINSQSVADAVYAARNVLQQPDTEIVKLGDNQAYLIDKNTGKIVKSFGGSSNASGIGGISGAVSAYTPIINTILGSGKFTKDQAASVTRAIQSGEDPVTVIKNNAKGLMTAADGSKVTGYEVAKGTLNDVNSQLKQFYANGGKTAYLTGNYEKVLNKLGNVEDPNLVDIATQIAASLQVYRNAVSGTAYSVQEGADIASIFPGINKSQGLNEAIIKGRMKAFDSAIDNSYKSVLGEKAYSQLKQTNADRTISKGNLNDNMFIEKAVQAQSRPYMDIVNSTPVGQIPVAINSTGEIGYIPIEEFTNSEYTKL